uniref:Uncharacterized protein LOC104220466 n=1 Tax=Nicotiana sylvestris TaxID=4096 RepID=A0A1U7VP16_NICSY
MASLAHLKPCQRSLAREVHQLASLGVRLVDSNEGGVIVQNRTESFLVVEVKEKQYKDPFLVQLKEGIYKRKTTYISLGMDDGLPRTPCKFDSIWVIMDRLTKSAHFLLIKSTDTAELYAQLYIREIVRLHGTLVSIISDRGAQFTNNFWKKFQQGLGTQVNLSTTFHPQTDGWFEIGEAELIGPYLVHQAMEKVKIIKEWLKTSQSRQKSYSDVRRRDLEFKEYDWVFLKVSPMKGIMHFGKKGKLNLRYVRPYRIIQRIGQVAYKLEMSLEMSQVHPIFHVSMLKKVVGDPSLIVPVETIEFNEELSYEEIPVDILD